MSHINETIMEALKTGSGIVCKFRFSGIKTTDVSGQRQTDIEMFPVYHNNDPNHENSKFWKYTPNGDFRMSTINQSAVDMLELGSEYYIYIVKAPQALNVPK